ncbi:MAG: MFS transporter, partial [Proteobacteria bacterium]|nr:MFS transporter [Pseudomonadota bacterium]
IPMGLLADRYSQKAIGTISLVLTMAGIVIFASGRTFPVLALGRFIAGAGAITLVVVAPQLLAQWFAGREIGIAMGIFHTAMPIGTILSLNFLSILGERLGWRASILFSAGVALVALVVFLLLFAPAPKKAKPLSGPSEPLFEGLRLAGSSIWLVGAAWMLYNAAAISMYTFTPDLLKANGFSIARAGFYTSIFVWPALVLGPLVGYATDKVGRKATIVGIGGIYFAALLVWIPSTTDWLVALIVFIGMGQSMVPTPIYALVPDVIRPERLGLGFGIITTCVNLGIVIGPFTTGLMKDISGSYQASYMLMAGFALLVTVSMILLGIKRRYLLSPLPTQKP